MKVQLLHRYSGILTQERKLHEGIHDLDATFAEYLVDNGHAVYVPDDTPVQVVQEKKPLEHDHTVHNEIMRKTGRLEAIISDDPPLPEITEDVVTEERTSTPTSRNKRRK